MKKNNYYIGCGLIAAVTLGLSGCYMDNYYGKSAQEREYASQHHTMSGSNAGMTDNKTAVAKVEKSSKAPAQKTMPGPKQQAAPQLPVIQ